MKIQFDFSKYKDKKVVMHCPTEELAELWCDYMHENGLTWNNGEYYENDAYWLEYREKTCYYFNEGLSGTVAEVKNNDYKILEIEDFIVRTLTPEEFMEELMEPTTKTSKEFTIKDLYIGLVVTLRNGEELIIIDISDSNLKLLRIPNRTDYTLSYNNNLIEKDYKELDIMKVERYISRTEKELLWEREEAVEVDWTKVERGTIIEVSHNGENWVKREFYLFDNEFAKPFVVYGEPHRELINCKHARLVKE